MIRRAERKDCSRIAEIFVFNNRINYYPIFNDIAFSFGDLQVASIIASYFGKEEVLNHIYVYEDEVIYGFMEIDGNELKKLYVDPILQNQGIGEKLLEDAVVHHHVNYLWALQKNTKALRFYERHHFHPNGEEKLEFETPEVLVKLTYNH